MYQEVFFLFYRTKSNFQWVSDDQPSCSEAPYEMEDIIIEENLEINSEINSQSCKEEGTRYKEQSSSKSTKRQRLGNESRERFDRLCDTIETVIGAKSATVPSKNSAFLQMLDECLQKKPEEVQDRLKIELLSYVHNAN